MFRGIGLKKIRKGGGMKSLSAKTFNWLVNFFETLEIHGGHLETTATGEGCQLTIDAYRVKEQDLFPQGNKWTFGYSFTADEEGDIFINIHNVTILMGQTYLSGGELSIAWPASQPTPGMVQVRLLIDWDSLPTLNSFAQEVPEMFSLTLSPTKPSLGSREQLVPLYEFNYNTRKLEKDYIHGIVSSQIWLPYEALHFSESEGE